MDSTTINDAATICGGLDSALGRIDQYELVRELGGGGFGTVYLARDTVAGIEVAVKGLPPMIKNNAEELERIRENFALVSRLHHPYIAAALHLQLAGDVRYHAESVRQKLRVMPGDTLMVMEHAPGVTLSKWRRQFPDGKVPLVPAIQLVWQIAQALDYAHEQHIIHRDIKPSNIMVETKPDGEVVARLLDFGLAAEIRSSMGRVSREIHDTSGTRPYMAPEQWEGRKQGPATDQYALAVLLCELLTGEVPFASAFETGDPIVMMTAVCNREVELPEDCPRKMALRRALAKEPEGRFASCMEFVEAAARATPQGSSTQVAPTPPQGGRRQVAPTPQQGGRRQVGRNVGLWLAVGVASMVVAIVGTLLYAQLQNKQAAARAAAERARIIAAQKAEEERIAAERRAEEARLRTEAERKAWEEARRKEQANEIRIAAENKAKAEATEIRIEAKVQQGKVERISDTDGFKARKDSLEDVFIRAEAFYDDSARRWAEAKALYGDYIEQSKSVISLDGERQAAVAKRSEVQASFKKAEEAGAKTYARDSWNAAVKTWNAAAAEFGRREFAAASGTFAKALKEFDECSDEARNNKRIAEEKRAEEKRLTEERAAEQRRRIELARQTEERRRQEERRKAMQSLPGKWMCNAKISGSSLRYEIEFGRDGSYIERKILDGSTTIYAGEWLQSGNRLTMRWPSYKIQSQGETYSYDTSGEDVHLIIWRADGTFELRYDINHMKKTRNDIRFCHYDEDGTFRACFTYKQFFMTQEVEYTETAKIFRRVSN